MKPSTDDVPRLSPHRTRQTWMIVALAAVAALAVVVTRWFNHEDRAELRALAEFGSSYSSECDAPNFAQPPSAVVRDAYLHSRALQAVIAEQTQALASGASCESVRRALRAADFPIPVAEAGRPSVHL